MQGVNNLGSHPLNSSSTLNHWATKITPANFQSTFRGWTFLIDSHYHGIGLNIVLIHVFALQLMDLNEQYCAI